MRTRAAAFALVLVGVGIGLDAQTPSSTTGAQAGDGSKYEALVQRVVNGDKTVDFTELRTAFTETPQYDQLKVLGMALYQGLWAALVQQNFPEALDRAKSAIARDFVEVNAHMVASMAYDRTGDAERAAFHRFVANGLLNSIRSSGDGKTEATAFHVVSISEEYALVVRAMGMRPVIVGSRLPRNGEHGYDSFVAADRQTGTERTFYFNIDAMYTSRPK